MAVEMKYSYPSAQWQSNIRPFPFLQLAYTTHESIELYINSYSQEVDYRKVI